MDPRSAQGQYATGAAGQQPRHGYRWWMTRVVVPILSVVLGGAAFLATPLGQTLTGHGQDSQGFSCGLIASMLADAYTQDNLVFESKPEFIPDDADTLCVATDKGDAYNTGITFGVYKSTKKFTGAQAYAFDVENEMSDPSSVGCQPTGQTDLGYIDGIARKPHGDPMAHMCKMTSDDPTFGGQSFTFVDTAGNEFNLQVQSFNPTTSVDGPLMVQLLLTELHRVGW